MEEEGAREGNEKDRDVEGHECGGKRRLEWWRLKWACSDEEWRIPRGRIEVNGRHGFWRPRFLVGEWDSPEREVECGEEPAEVEGRDAGAEKANDRLKWTRVHVERRGSHLTSGVSGERSESTARRG